MPLLAALLGGAWRLSARLTGLGARLTTLTTRIQDLEKDTGHELAAIKGTLTTLMKALVRGRALPEGMALEAALSPWQQQIEHERQRNNPLTPQELERFERYYKKVAERIPLEQCEFEDYQSLADKLYLDRPDDPGIWVLLGLGALLLALGLIKGAE